MSPLNVPCMRAIVTFMAKTEVPEERGQVWFHHKCVQSVPMSIARAHTKTLANLRLTCRQFNYLTTEYLVFNLSRILYKVLPMVVRGAMMPTEEGLRLTTLMAFLDQHPRIGGLKLHLHVLCPDLLHSIEPLVKILTTKLISTTHVYLELGGMDHIADALIAALSGSQPKYVRTLKLNRVTAAGIDLREYSGLKSMSLIGCSIQEIRFTKQHRLSLLELVPKMDLYETRVYPVLPQPIDVDTLVMLSPLSRPYHDIATSIRSVNQCVIIDHHPPIEALKPFSLAEWDHSLKKLFVSRTLLDRPNRPTEALPDEAATLLLDHRRISIPLRGKFYSSGIITVI